jgi:hypothetical protein
VRVVCNNTLTIALNGTSRAIKVPHNTRFDPQAVKSNWASPSRNGTNLCTACAHWLNARCSGMRRWASS